MFISETFWYLETEINSFPKNLSWEGNKQQGWGTSRRKGLAKKKLLTPPPLTFCSEMASAQQKKTVKSHKTVQGSDHM